VRRSSNFDGVVPAVQEFEQTASTAPPELPEALEQTRPKSETSGTSGSLTPSTFVRKIFFAVAISALSADPRRYVPQPWGRHGIAISADSSPAYADQSLLEQMRQIFETGASEFFEDGMDSDFANQLLRSVMEHGNAAIDAIAEYLFSSTASSDAGSEALRRLAGIDDRRILTSRWDLLRRGLRHKSSRVRDGAILAFASLDDSSALALLESAEAEETVPELRRLIQKVIEQLGGIHA